MNTVTMDTTTLPTADPLPLLRLLQLASPALPVGAFNFSQGTGIRGRPGLGR